MKIGNKIKTLRNLCGLTQSELASRCELTKGYISQLENDLTEPSISTLEDILLALGTNFKDFFNDCDNDQIVFKEADYFVKETEDYKINWLVWNAQKNEMEPILMELNPGTATDMDTAHEGEEFGYVLQGKIELYIGNKKYDVGLNETFYFSSHKPHYIKNTGKEVAKLLWISTPPNF